MTEERRATFEELCARIRAMDPTVAPGPELDKLAADLEALDARYVAERASAAVDAKRNLADLAELQYANRMAAVGTLTTGMAHELGTPLGVVLARAQMIVSDEIDLADARSDAQEIIRQVKRMTQMCTEVLDFARPRPPARDPVDVVQLARQIIALLVPEARKHGARLVMTGDPAPAFVLGDPSRLMQIFTNLIINAVQAMPSGGTVTLAIERKRLDPPASEQLPAADYISIHVQDNGTGIRNADLRHIFDTFFTTKKAEGTGIGLAISARIAREHEGWIDVITAEGRGSTFTLNLPAITA